MALYTLNNVLDAGSFDVTGSLIKSIGIAKKTLSICQNFTTYITCKEKDMIRFIHFSFFIIFLSKGKLVI